MDKHNAHPMFLVREAIMKLSESYLNSYKTREEDNPITDEEKNAISAHFDSLNELFMSYQERVKK